MADILLLYEPERETEGAAEMGRREGRRRGKEGRGPEGGRGPGPPLRGAPCAAAATPPRGAGAGRAGAPGVRPLLRSLLLALLPPAAASPSPPLPPAPPLPAESVAEPAARLQSCGSRFCTYVVSNPPLPKGKCGRPASLPTPQPPCPGHSSHFFSGIGALKRGSLTLAPVRVPLGTPRQPRRSGAGRCPVRTHKGQSFSGTWPTYLHRKLGLC